MPKKSQINEYSDQSLHSHCIDEEEVDMLGWNIGIFDTMFLVLWEL